MSTRRPTILVVDDDVDTCRNLYDILTDVGYEVFFVHDGLAALELVKKQPFDVALLDFKMPGMDGLTLYREIKKLRAETVAILISAFADQRTTEDALEAGAWRVLAKPVDFGALLSLVSQALDQPLVMVVDDDPDLCANLWDLLHERGYRVTVAHDADQAREQLQVQNFAVVLIDMKLPRGDGKEVFHLVRDLNPKARCMVITGLRSEMEQAIQQVLQEGAEGVVYKPFDMPQFLGTLEKLTAGKKADKC